MPEQYRRQYQEDDYRGPRRPWTDRAVDEMRSWTGDDDAQRRRDYDERQERSYQAGERSSYDEGNRGDTRRWHPRGGQQYGGRSFENQGGQWRPADADRPTRSMSGGWERENESQRSSSERNRGRLGATPYAEGDDNYGGASSYRMSASGYGEYGSSFDGGSYGESGRSSSRGMGGSETSQYGRSSRGGFAGKGPKDYQRSDDRIREEISDRLTDDDDIDAGEINVEVKSGEVTLSGTVSDRNQKRRAEDLIERLSGVKEVINNLRVSQQNQSMSGQSGSSMSGQGGQTGQSNQTQTSEGKTGSKSTGAGR